MFAMDSMGSWLFICIYDVYYWIYGAPYNRWISALLYPTTRIIWSLNTALIIWMCITGNGGLVNKFLSWKAYIPLSRLTYSVYLTHVWIIWKFWGSRRDSMDINNISILSVILGVLLMSYIIGAIFSLLFESPFLKLQKYLKILYIINEREGIRNNFNVNESDGNEMKNLYKSVENK